LAQIGKRELDSELAGDEVISTRDASTAGLGIERQVLFARAVSIQKIC
jgi:hypothetical protein